MAPAGWLSCHLARSLSPERGRGAPASTTGQRWKRGDGAYAGPRSKVHTYSPDTRCTRSAAWADSLCAPSFVCDRRGSLIQYPRVALWTSLASNLRLARRVMPPLEDKGPLGAAVPPGAHRMDIPCRKLETSAGTRVPMLHLVNGWSHSERRSLENAVLASSQRLYLSAPTTWLPENAFSSLRMWLFDAR